MRTIVLSDQGKKLLHDIFVACLKSPKGIDRARFRADNAEFIPELDRLEILGYLQRRNDLYSVNPLALAYLAKENPDAQSMVQKCDLIFALLQRNYRDNLGEIISFSDIAKETGLSVDDVRAAFSFIVQIPILEGYSIEKELIAPSEGILRYKSFEDILKEQEERDKQRYAQLRKSREPSHIQPEHLVEHESLLSATSSKANWKAIETEFGITKMGFGRKINFITDTFERTIIFRDVEQAFVLASSGFSKPAVILAGGVIEELLRLYLEYKHIKPIKDSFDGYIQTCQQKKLLEVGISRLSDSARHFRNLVHLSKEKTKRHTTSKSKAKGAVASIFTIANDF